MAQKGAKPVAHTPEGRPIWAYRPDGRACCGSKKGDGVCGITILCANGRCKDHGGTRLKGVLAPAFQGRAPKYPSLPDKLADRLRMFLERDDILSLKTDIALQDVRLDQLLGEFERGAGSEIWDLLAEAYGPCGAALSDVRMDDSEKLDLYEIGLEKIGRIINQGKNERLTWHDIGKASELRRKLTETETKNQQAAQMTMSAEQVFTLFFTFLAIIRDLVKDKDTLKELQRRTSSLVGDHGSLLGTMMDASEKMASKVAKLAPPPTIIEMPAEAEKETE